MWKFSVILLGHQLILPVCLLHSLLCLELSDRKQTKQKQSLEVYLSPRIYLIQNTDTLKIVLFSKF